MTIEEMRNSMLDAGVYSKADIDKILANCNGQTLKVTVKRNQNQEEMKIALMKEN